MPRIFRVDIESFSDADLPSVGAYRYARDPSTEMLMVALAEGDEEPVLWIPERYAAKKMFASEKATRLMEEMADEDVIIYAFNSQFEFSMFEACMEREGFRCPRIEQFRCTAAMARKAALPADLDGAARTLRLKQRKDPNGTALMNVFSKPDSEGRRTMPLDEPEKFWQFGQYCLQDVRVEVEVHHKLNKFEMTGFTLDTFLFDAKMNHRGIPVNLPGLRKALKIIKEEGLIITEEFRSFVGLNPTQVQKVKAWMQARGYPYDNLKADTIEEFMDRVTAGELPCRDDLRRAIYLKSMISFAATSKVQSMLSCAGADARVRGVLMFCGARTGRWSAKLIQIQNFKRPTELDGRLEYSLRHPELSSDHIKKLYGPQTSFEAYRDICNGLPREGVRALYGPPLEVISSCIRHFIQLPAGKMFNADYAAIEARIVCWLAGEEKALRRFRNKEPIYEIMGGIVFGMPTEKVSKKGVERFVGKQTILGCGFGMGVDKFLATCANFGQRLPRELGERAVEAYRSEHPKVKALWRDAERAARAAINHPNQMFRAGKLRFFSTHTAGMKYLVMKLPSDRLIVYPDPRIEDDSITFYGQVKGRNWGRVYTYGGKLVENGTQGVAADVMANGAINCEREGYEIFALIHDEALAEPKPHQTLERFCKLLTTLPPWADGLPIEAEGDMIHVYTK